MERVEFWPDHGGALLHTEGQRVALDAFDLPEELLAVLGRWLAQYEDARLEPATRDSAWIAEGQQLFDRLRDELSRAGVELIDWEGYWDRSRADQAGD